MIESGMRYIIQIWNGFVGWFWPHFWRNNLVIAVALVILIVIAKTAG